MSQSQHSHSVNRYTPRTGDPTATKHIREQYETTLVSWLDKLSEAIVTAIVENEIFKNLELAENQKKPKKVEEPEPPQQPYQFPTSQVMVTQFMNWLRSQLQSGFLNLVGPASNQFVQDAYEMGAEHAQTLLPFETDIQFDSPSFRNGLRELYVRNYELLQDVSEDMAHGIRETLTEGFKQGHNPNKIAREMTEEVDDIGKYRSTLIARTEVINAHSEGSLQHYENTNIEGVTLQAELLTAHDERVCTICESIEDMGVFSLNEVRDKSVKINDRYYSVKPPVHPQCRCALLPYTGALD